MAIINKRFGATDGFIKMPDGSEHYVFGWVDITGVPEDKIFSYRGRCQLPGPLLEAKVGDEVYLTITNLGMPGRPDLDDSHTVHWHGFPNQISIYDGVPEASIAIPVGRDFVYYYKPLNPGTYMYHCHFEPVEHIQMGMVGPLLVRPADFDASDPIYKTAYGNGTGTEFDREYFIFLTELDATAHRQIIAVQEYDWTEYKPDYWLINGRAYPDTIKDIGSNLPYQPYHTHIKANTGEKILLRFVNLGYQQHSMEILGIPLHIIGQDAQRPLGLNSEDLSYRKNVLYFAAGQTIDAIFTAPAPGNYPLFNRNCHKNVNNGVALGGMVTEVKIYPGTLPPPPGPTTKNFSLWAKDGYISMPDGNSIYIWGYAGTDDGMAQLPGPRIIVNQGDTVNITLINTLPEASSLLFPGQENVTVDDGTGPHSVQPGFDGSGNLISLADFADSPGNSGGKPTTVTYTFTADNPGTYLYESGTNPHKQVPMGLFGAIIVRPADYDPKVPSKKTAYGEDTQTEFDREYLLMVSEIDPELHRAVERGHDYKIRDRKPRYWTMNGRAAHDTMSPDNVGFLPNQPYGSMIMAEPNEKVLLRYIGVGIENHPMHAHGNHTRLVALDGRLLKNGTQDLSYQRFTVLVSSGQTYDQIFTWSGLGFTPTNSIPTVLPNSRNQIIGTMGWTVYSGSPYLGEKGEIPEDVVSYNEVGEYHFMLHSHEEPQITNWGEFPGGLMTMIAIYPVGTLDHHVGTLDEHEHSGEEEHH